MKKNYFLLTLAVVTFLGSCGDHAHAPAGFSLKANADAKSTELLEAMEGVNGGWNHIAEKKDVVFTYKYDDKSKGIDLSTEKYIFDGEHIGGTGPTINKVKTLLKAIPISERTSTGTATRRRNINRRQPTAPPNTATANAAVAQAGRPKMIT